MTKLSSSVCGKRTSAILEFYQV